MGFWIAVTLTLLAATGALALGARRAHGKSEGEADLALYRDQLREVERDLARGTIAPDEAERLRLEVSRRLLAADKAARAAAAERQGPLLTGLALAGVILAGAVLLYAQIGAPGMGDLPRKARIEAAAQARAERPAQEAMEATQPPWSAPEGADPAWLNLVERLRVALREHPDDAQGLRLLAENEAQLGNFAAAWRAQAQLVALAEPVAQDLVLQAAMMIEAAGGRISPEAEAVAARALQRDPLAGGALYFLGMAQAQIGRPDRAFELWAPLLARSGAGDWWVAPLRADLPMIAALAGESRYELPPLPASPAPDATPGPTAAEMEAAAEMDAVARAEMVRGMIERLAERLATEGGPAPEWAQLIRALGVLGETTRASAILAEARTVFAADAEALAQLEAAARAAGLEG